RSAGIELSSLLLSKAQPCPKNRTPRPLINFWYRQMPLILSAFLISHLVSSSYWVLVNMSWSFPGGDTVGHFGLAVKDYSHSTAPNRRYPDLITQRLLKAAIADLTLPYENDELEAIAKHCTEKEEAKCKYRVLHADTGCGYLLPDHFRSQDRYARTSPGPRP
ncbi:MAG TPA: hypothetical protein DEO84_10200, partial [candidate division Zixibacteria bacterium]|nr:hypothetical protein [candidate division Zixibacteria bacterium]